MLATGWRWSALFLIVVLLVASGSCRTIDSAVADGTAQAHVPVLDWLASIVGLLGRAEVGAGLALGLAVARFRRHRRGALIPLLIAVTVVVELLLKVFVIQAPPPPGRSTAIDLLPTVYVPFPNSFPSGHVARTAFLLRIANGMPTAVLVGGIALMAVTRVYLGEHWLSDTVGGAVVGLGVATIARRLA